MRNLARRTLTAIAMAAMLSVYMAAPVAAKMTPFFTIAMVPSQPVAGQPMVVVVRTWDDAGHTVPAHFDSAVALDGLLVLRSTADGSGDIPIPLRYEAPDEFTATFVAPAAGEWKLVAFPDRTGWASPDVPPSYPDTIAVTVLPEGGEAMMVWVVAGLAAAVLGIAASRFSGRTPGTGSSGSAAGSPPRPAPRPGAPAGTVR